MHGPVREFVRSVFQFKSGWRDEFRPPRGQNKTSLCEEKVQGGSEDSSGTCPANGTRARVTDMRPGPEGQRYHDWQQSFGGTTTVS